MEKLTILCVTYNHDKYIRQALNGFVKQITNFKYQILISDDASTDNTQRIIKEFSNRYPKIIKSILRSKNVGGKENFEHALSLIKSEFIAICEGDDYWTDPNKLQKQVDYLEKNMEYSICSHNVIVRDETGVEIKEHEWLGKDHRQNSTIEDILKYGSGGATCSLVFCHSAFTGYPEWSKSIKGGDWLLQILCCMSGKMKYFPEVMGVYRRHKYNSLFAAKKRELFKGNKDVIGLPHKYLLEAAKIIDKNLNYKYHKELLNQKRYAYLNLAIEYKRQQKLIPAIKSYIYYLLNEAEMKL